MNFLDWLQEKINSEGLTYEEFGRKAGFSKSHISLILNGKRSVTANFCKGVAKALGANSVDVLALAGLLEARERRIDYKTEDYLILFQKLPPEGKEKAISFVKFLLSEYD